MLFRWSFLLYRMSINILLFRRDKIIITPVNSFIILFYLALNAFTFNIYAQEYIKFNEELVIGEELSSRKELLFARPDFIVTDSKGAIYISELVDKTIRKFDKNGSYLFSFGRRGKGPGEFQDITVFSINNGDTLIIADQFLYRISFFSTDGKYLNAIKMNSQGMLWPRKILQLNSGDYILGYKMENEPEIFHIYNSSFTRKVNSFGKDAVVIHDNPYVDSAAVIIFRGKIAVLKNNDILYSPFLYDGNIYYYNSILNKQWKLKYKIKGFLESKNPYLDINPNIKKYDHSDPPWSFKGYNSGNSYAAVLMNESRGLFILNNGNIINFTLIKHGGYREFGFDLFNKNGSFMKHYFMYKEKLRTDMPTDIPIYVEWKDKNDNFYFKDLTGYPKIKKIKIIF